MDYKEQYKKALEKARIWKEKSGMPKDKQGILDDIFPELCESEDEKIRKELIEHVKDQQSSFISAPDCRDKYEEEENDKYNSWLAWLEKQDEQKPDLYPLCTTVKEKIRTYIANNFITDEVVKTDVKSIVHAMEEGVRLGKEENKSTWNEEDKRMREEIIAFIKSVAYAKTDDVKKYVAWLEKQGNEPNWCHHKVDLSGCSEEYRKAYYDGWNNCNQQHSQCKSEWNDVVKCLINGMKFYYEDNEEATWGTEKFSMKVKDILSWLEKQGEQNPTDNVEPKFKVGDWIIDDKNRVGIIVRILDEHYIISFDGREVQISFEWEGKLFRKWSIKDAKDGDVLASEDNCICIFDNTVEEGKYPFAYCGLSMYGFKVYDRTLPFTHDNVYPATKEQRDLLFQKIKEAGYEWDAEKKELRKIEPTETAKWSAQEEYCICELEAMVREAWGKAENVRNDITIKKMQELMFFLKTLNPNMPQSKQEWDEEDEEMFKSLKTLLNDASCYSCTEGVDKILAWLKQKIGR